MLRINQVLEKFNSDKMSDTMDSLALLDSLSKQGIGEFAGLDENRFSTLARSMGLLIPLAMQLEMRQSEPSLADIGAWHKADGHNAFEKIATLAFCIGWASRGEADNAQKLQWVVADETPKKDIGHGE